MAALVGREGSIDWLCLPRFDSGAVFAALLGDERHGRWLLAPSGGIRRVSRRYRPGTLVLETEFETEDGVAQVVDCMPPVDGAVSVVRVVEGVKGRVQLRMQLVIRLDYPSLASWGLPSDEDDCRPLQSCRRSASVQRRERLGGLVHEYYRVLA